ncbi:MAG: hypothetical protein J2P36_03685 [Ktedonobacteraceae bacterium]|nr:hypothetical protein [Ktedonobacteraceae bacterium]
MKMSYTGDGIGQHPEVPVSTERYEPGELSDWGCQEAPPSVAPGIGKARRRSSFIGGI